MPRVSGYETLPPEHRAWLLREWRRRGYGDTARIAEELAARLTADGLDGDPLIPEAPSVSTVWRWAKAAQARDSQVRFAAELRAATIAALPEDDPTLADRVGAYMEGRVVEALEELDTLEGLDPLERIDALAKLTAANTSRRKVHLERERQELARARFDAEQAIRNEERSKAAGAAESAARTQGVSPEGIAALRAAIMGAL